MKKLILILSIALNFACSNEHNGGYTGLPSENYTQPSFDQGNSGLAFKSNMDLRNFIGILNRKIETTREYLTGDILDQFITDSIITVYRNVDYSVIDNYPEVFSYSVIPIDMWTTDMKKNAIDLLFQQAIELPGTPCPGDDMLETLPCTQTYNNQVTVATLVYIAAIVKAAEEAALNPAWGSAEAAVATVAYVTAIQTAGSEWCSCLVSTYGSPAPQGC